MPQLRRADQKPQRELSLHEVRLAEHRARRRRDPQLREVWRARSGDPAPRAAASRYRAHSDPARGEAWRGADSLSAEISGLVAGGFGGLHVHRAGDGVALGDGESGNRPRRRSAPAAACEQPRTGHELSDRLVITKIYKDVEWRRA